MNTHPCSRARFFFPLAVLGFLAVFTFAVYSLWNGVLTDVLPVKAISYWQALGLFVLCKILFGGFPGRGGRFGPPWRERMLSQRWDSLTPEEREKLREKMRYRFGRCQPWSESEAAKPTPPPEKTDA